ncbi:NAD(P)H-binding protein [Nakamurella sp. YIM 132087]|uniref:NAD(P)H-binding protein n=1 Tax=Nakamurella alba TaxID=2665158 RepID=A0A7K1FHJ3_9ACTN|nr:SDR family oxidoreductase [Nakamurella alba]MTD13591.1 NAD(P)H-binding protein [Nakamurella alba]
MDVLVIGGHGKVALLLAQQLTARGDTVSSVIRNPDHADDVAAAGATPLVLDIESANPEQLAAVIADHDATVFSAGAGGGNPERTYAVDRDAAIRCMDAADRPGVPRFVLVSYFGAGPEHGVPADNPFHHYAEAKAAADTYLRHSRLDWVIVGPSALTLDPGTGRIATREQGATGTSVSREDVAAVIAAVLATPSISDRMIEFDTGDTPIDEALQQLP